MSKTRDQIKLRALQVLGVIQAGQPVSAEDAETIDVEATAERLAGKRTAELRGVVRNDTLPDEFFVPFSQVVAADHAVIYGMGVSDAAALRSDGEAAIAEIVRRTRPVQTIKIDTIVGW